jgi:NADH-quinone oxidoreductase subunit J
MMEVLLFSGLAAIAIISGVVVVATKHAIVSALALVVNLCTLAVFYFALGSQLLGVVQIFVYLGAIMVLFLFCIMLLRLGPEDALEERGGLKRLAAVILALLFLGIVYSQVIGPIRVAAEPEEMVRLHQTVSTVEAIGQGLFTRWALPFEITSLLLLVAIVGSVLLAKRRL